MKISIGHSSTSATLFNEKSSEATRLNCGFNCLEKCHLCNASDWHVVTADAEWRGTVGNRRIGEPFKPGPNPMLTIPGLERDSILPDSCHCCHLGWGIDFCCKWVSPPMQKDVLQQWNFESSTALCLQEILEMVRCQWQNYRYWLVVSQKTWYENVPWTKFQLT